MQHKNILRRTYLLLLGVAILGLWAFQKPTVTALKIVIPNPQYPKNYFSSPIGYAIKLTGTFGELRGNHFHAGIDLKSPNGKTGAPIFASADGFIDRIKVQASGYGNAIYIKHPNGYTTVYAHLDEFMSPIATYVKEQQYNKEQFEVYLYPKDGQFKVRKGQQIGTLGNSGGSTGPHLHFEIRNSATDHALNPLLFNMPVPDNVPPTIRGLKAYTFNDQQEIINERPVNFRKISEGNYGIDGDTLVLGGWRAGFSIKTYDSMTGFNNDNGIYSLTFEADDTRVFFFELNEFDFDETRYLNAHIDYAAKEAGFGYFQRCYRQAGDQFSGTKSNVNNGIVSIYTEKPVKCKIIIADAHGNTSNILFWVKRSDLINDPVREPYQYFCEYNRDNHISGENYSFKMPKGTLYSNLYLQYNTSYDQSSGIYSPVHHLHNTKTPLHKYCDIAIRPDPLPEELRAKAFIAQCNDSKPLSCGGKWEGDRLVAKVRELGNYCVMVDTEAPTITPIVFEQDMRKKGKMSFRLKDNYGITGNAADIKYEATIDGKWILMELDSKSDRLTHSFDGRIAPGSHKLRLVAKDNRGNETVLEREFVR